MESLFRLTELESRIPLNVNVLAGGQGAEGARPRRVPARVARPPPRGAAAPLAPPPRARSSGGWRSSRGLLIVYLDLDRVIRIIREEDEPKQELMRVFKLTELQANAILDTRLRSLRKLEEMELKRELNELTGEKGEIESLLGSRADAVEDGRRRDPRGAEDLRARDAARPAPHELRRGARTPPRSTSPRRWSSASRSP